MQLKIVFKIIYAAAVLIVAAEAAARAETPSPVAPAAAPPPANVIAAPGVTGPRLELPAERDMPQMTLPRETAIENPLRAISAASATAIGGYGELTLNTPSNNLIPPHNGPAVVSTASRCAGFRSWVRNLGCTAAESAICPRRFHPVIHNRWR